MSSSPDRADLVLQKHVTYGAVCVPVSIFNSPQLEQHLG